MTAQCIKHAQPMLDLGGMPTMDCTEWERMRGLLHEKCTVCVLLHPVTHHVGISLKFMQRFQFSTQQPREGTEPQETHKDIAEQTIQRVEQANVGKFMAQQRGMTVTACAIYENREIGMKIIGTEHHRTSPTDGRSNARMCIDANLAYSKRTLALSYQLDVARQRKQIPQQKEARCEYIYKE